MAAMYQMTITNHTGIKLTLPFTNYLHAYEVARRCRDKGLTVDFPGAPFALYDSVSEAMDTVSLYFGSWFDAGK